MSEVQVVNLGQERRRRPRKPSATFTVLMDVRDRNAPVLAVAPEALARPLGERLNMDDVDFAFGSIEAAKSAAAKAFGERGYILVPWKCTRLQGSEVWSTVGIPLAAIAEPAGYA